MKSQTWINCLLAFILYAVESRSEQLLQNPVIPGYFADPSLVQHDGKFYLYATVDPWGADYLACWVSDDFRNWTYHTLNWPTKQACTSPLSVNNKVWAPSVVKRGNKFYMYISVGSEVWCGTADHPLGPWKNMLGDKPMIPFDKTRYYHVIDAEAFLDDDGKAYLYWGSGWGWINGHCFAAELDDDMASFKTKPVEVTPSRYFEGPLMLKHDGKYYLTYSEGKTVDETYEVRYAVGDNPFGPFAEADNSPILKTDEKLQVFGPGHHAVFTFRDKRYILYHKHRLPFKRGSAYRQICINEMVFEKDKSQIETIVPNLTQSFPELDDSKPQHVAPSSVTVSSQHSALNCGEMMIDNHYGTLWQAAEEDEHPLITATFSEETEISQMEIRFEYPGVTYYPKVETTTNGTDWALVVDHTEDGVSGSPVILSIQRKVRQVRISFSQKNKTVSAVWEWRFSRPQ